MVVMHFGAAATVLLSDNVDVELARIKAPDDAVAFVERFGLLTQTYRGDTLDLDIGDALTDFGTQVYSDLETHREPFETFASSAADLRDILLRMKQVRAALAN